MLHDSLDAYAKPPVVIHEIYKKYQKLVPSQPSEASILVESVPANVVLQKCHDEHLLVRQLAGDQGLRSTCSRFLADNASKDMPGKFASSNDSAEITVYDVPEFPGE